MTMFELIHLLSSKNGDELFEKTEAILNQFGVNVYNEDGSVKNLYIVICEVADIMNKKKAGE